MSLSAPLSKSFGEMPDFRHICIPCFHSLAFHGPVNSDCRFKHLQGRKVREPTANQHLNPEFFRARTGHFCDFGTAPDVLSMEQQERTVHLVASSMPLRESLVLASRPPTLEKFHWTCRFRRDGSDLIVGVHDARDCREHTLHPHGHAFVRVCGPKMMPVCFE